MHFPLLDGIRRWGIARRLKSSSEARPALARCRPKLVCLEDRTVLNYSFGAVAYEPITLQQDTPGAFAILSQGDDSTANVSLGNHQINFYGTNYSNLFASSNGLLTFGSGNASAMNSDLKFSPTQPAIAPLWSDWYKDSGGPMILGKIDGNNLIIQWDNVLHFDSQTPVTFQVVIQMNTGNTPGAITVNYLNVDTGDVHANGGTSTVGVKAAGFQGSNRVLVSFNSQNPLIGNSQALQFAWADANPAPVITFLNPSSAFEGSGDLMLTVGGQNFLAGSVVQVNGAALSTTFISGTQLEAELTSSFLMTTGALTITVENPGSPGQTSNPFVFSVLDAPLNAAGLPFTATEGSAFTGAVATFTDLNPNSLAGDFQATITWGDDGATQGTVTSDGQGGFIVTGTHTYTFFGSYAFSVEIIDLIGGASTTAFGTATVLDAPLTAHGVTITATAGGGFLGQVATFTDANPFGQPEHYAATIHWGDGTTTPGRVSAAAGGGFLVNGGHTYPNPGNYSYSVLITDTTSGGTATATGTTLVRGRNPDLDLEVRKRNNDRKIALTINYRDLPAGSHRLRINWGDGDKQDFKIGTTSEGAVELKHQYGYWFAWNHRNRGTDIQVNVLNQAGKIIATESIHLGFEGFAKSWWYALLTAECSR